MAHGNARLNEWGRLLLVDRIEGGMPVTDAAAMGGISRPCAYKWWRRWREEGLAGLADRMVASASVAVADQPGGGAEGDRSPVAATGGPGVVGVRDRRPGADDYSHPAPLGIPTCGTATP